MPKRQFVVFCVLVGALYCLTWGRPWIATLVPADSWMARLAAMAAFGGALVVGGWFLARTGLRNLWGAVTQQQIKCPSCHGTGHGERRWYQKFVNYGSDLMGNPVWMPEWQATHDCWQCRGAGVLGTGTFKEGVLKSCGGAFMICVGLIIFSGWREWASGATPLFQSPAAVAVTKPSSKEPVISVDAPAAVTPASKPTERQDPSGNTQPITPGSITITGREEESNGNIWEFRGELKVTGRGVYGPLTFTLKVTTDPYRQSRVGSSAEMSIEGTVVGKKLILAGTRVSDVTLIGVGRYELIIDPGLGTFHGVLPQGGGTLKGTVNHWPFD